jgi:NAD(P)-dependent dehydrogenase (short-subunit alcohol dehydrogenase family)
MKQVIIITGASSGFGRLSANALARAGHIVYASMRGTTGRNAAQAADVEKYAGDNSVDLRAVELDVGSQESADAAVARVVAEQGRLDVVIHNAGHMVFGPAEAFTPEQLAELYDINVLSTQRVNRAALPQLRKQGQGLLVWVSSSSSAGGTPPYLAPYFAAKAGMDAMAVVYARELSRWGIETSIIVPGAFTGGTNHFAHSGSPADQARVAEYEAGPYAGFGDQTARRSPRSCRPRRTHRPWPMRSLGSSIRRSASGRSAFMSTRRKMALTSRSPSSTASVTRCCTVSDFPTSSSPGSVAETSTPAARKPPPACRSFAAQPSQDLRVHLARIAVAEILDLPVGDVGAGG